MPLAANAGFTPTEKGITVSLFDYCTDLFTVEAAPDKANSVSCSGASCTISKLLPKEIVEIRWTLKPRDVKLTTKCNLKVAVAYDYRTSSLTTMHFIDPSEFQRMLDRGQTPSDQSFISVGEGPLKGYLEVKDKQPIVANQGGTIIQTSMIIENKGAGFLASPDDKPPHVSKIEIVAPGNGLQVESGKCKAQDAPPGDIRLIKGTSTLLPCQLKMTESVAKETTRQVLVHVDYRYEFREDVDVTIEAKPEFQS